MDQLHHFRHHEHPLMFKEEAHKEKEDGAAVPAGGTFLCAACGELVLGSCYTCNQCSQFVLHKTCAELPRVISHLIHRKHPLILLPNKYYYCDVCRRHRRRLQSYSCRQCDFDLDIQCASNLSNIKYAEHFSHEHILIFREEKEKENVGSLVFCDGCREPVVGPSYSCPMSVCPYTLHKSCVELPLEIQHRVHTEHPLILSKETARECRCDSCNQDCSRIFTYSCYQCDFNLDLKCASDQNALKLDTHEHALMFKEDQEEGSLLSCDGCQDTQYMALVTLASIPTDVTNVASISTNHVRSYPVKSSIPCTANTLFFS